MEDVFIADFGYSKRSMLKMMMSSIFHIGKHRLIKGGKPCQKG